ncbi:hypothetical protein [Flavobacterium sp.]|uniref:hypothetical protein n=1 Tax=Flavobacterium sp. TaxID=239 RepID=UPI00262EB6A3|nr:hypothetical protein [Flavobacterium sp.]
MKKSILGLIGIQELTKNEQKSIQGGIHRCAIDGCPVGYCCTRVGCKTGSACIQI